MYVILAVGVVALILSILLCVKGVKRVQEPIAKPNEYPDESLYAEIEEGIYEKVTPKPIHDEEREDESGPPVNDQQYQELKDTRSKPIRVSDLEKYIRDTNNRPGGLTTEYKAVGSVVIWETGKSRANDGKSDADLYGNFPESFDYINATFFKGPSRKRYAFLVSPAPSKIVGPAFWQLAWEMRVSCMIALVTTEEAEALTGWPQKGAQKFGPYEVQLKNIIRQVHSQMAEVTVRAKGRTHTFPIFHYFAWPEGDAPVSPGSLVDFRHHVYQHQTAATGPAMIFCSSKLGRTGSYAALDNIIANGSSQGQIDVFGYTIYMRVKRPDMIQTMKQYRFLYYAAFEALCRTSKVILSSAVLSVVPRLFALDVKSGTTKLEKEYQTMHAIRPFYNSEMVESLAGNASYSSPFALVDNPCNPVLVGASVGMPYVTCSLPSHANVKHLLQLLLGQNSRTLVIIASKDQLGKLDFVPANTDVVLKTRGFTCTLESQKDEAHFSSKVLRLQSDHPTTKSTASLGPFRLKLLHYHLWSEYDSAPPSSGQCIKLLYEMHSWQDECNKKEPSSITIICRSGVLQTGLLCAASILMRRVLADGTVDVFNTVQQMRQARPDFINNVTQYRFLYELAMTMCG